MNILAIIGAVLKLIILMFNSGIESRKERKKKIEEAIGRMKDAIKKRDPSAVTSAWNDVNGV